VVFAFTCLALSLPLLQTIPSALTGVHKIVMMGDSITEIGGSPKGYVTLVTHALNALDPGHRRGSRLSER